VNVTVEGSERMYLPAISWQKTLAEEIARMRVAVHPERRLLFVLFAPMAAARVSIPA
jgi:hypothetical protein